MTGLKFTVQYSCLKGNEGGIPQKEAMAYLRDEIGMKVRRGYSPYVGHYGLEADGTKGQHEKAEQFLFG